MSEKTASQVSDIVTAAVNDPAFESFLAGVAAGRNLERIQQESGKEAKSDNR